MATAFVACCALAVALSPGRCLAEEGGAAELQSQADGMAEKVEQTTQAYNDACGEVKDVEGRIAQNEERIADIERRLPEQRKRAAASIKNLYMFQQSTPGLIELVLSSEDFGELLSTLRYIDAIQEHNTSEVRALADMQEDLVQTKVQLDGQHEEAKVKEDKARAALDEARAAREELQAKADAAAREEAAARAAAIAAAQSRADEAYSSEGSAATFTTASGNTATVEVAPEPDASTAPIVNNTTSSEVDQWAARIDAYLAGTNLAGHGRDFAQAASQYGVDPRISPAIACVESGKGAVCFLPHNAWGWGSSSWSDWTSAIYGHVSGFKSIYGSELTLEGAKMYASNDIYDIWYSTVLSEMASI